MKTNNEDIISIFRVMILKVFEYFSKIISKCFVVFHNISN